MWMGLSGKSTRAGFMLNEKQLAKLASQLGGRSRKGKIWRQEWDVRGFSKQAAVALPRAAARSLDDLVVRIGCCGCCLTCCVGTTCFSSADDRLVAARLRSRGFRDDGGWCDGDSGSEPPPPASPVEELVAVLGRFVPCLLEEVAALMLEVDVGALRDATVDEAASQGRAATAAADRDDVDADEAAGFEDDDDGWDLLWIALDVGVLAVDLDDDLKSGKRIEKEGRELIRKSGFIGNWVHLEVISN